MNKKSNDLDNFNFIQCSTMNCDEKNITKSDNIFMNTIMSKIEKLKTKNDYLSLYKSYKKNNKFIIINFVKCIMNKCKSEFVNGLIFFMKKLNSNSNSKIPEFMNDVISDTQKILQKSKYTDEDITKCSFHFLLVLYYTILDMFGEKIKF